ncbi:unnamed protein product [Ranitomeya imitator]|uniref:(2E,6E)-farnesyl diphosphate synthase n=1 Tax=Ranitomeya imitator TaxID=111125 RepID=A0ABN9LZC3_9NEOB|nr:unnamed protein product [Ranitomeya imitator]
MRLPIIREDQNVIQVNNQEFIQILTENVMHKRLKNRWSIGKSERHHQILKMTLGRIKCRFPFISLPDSHQIIRTTKINLSKPTSPLNPSKQVRYQWQGILKLNSDLIKKAADFELNVWDMSADGAAGVLGSFFAQIVHGSDCRGLGHPEIVERCLRLRQVLEYNAPGGKCNRGMTVLASYLELVGSRAAEDENIQRALAGGLVCRAGLAASDWTPSMIPSYWRPPYTVCPEEVLPTAAILPQVCWSFFWRPPIRQSWGQALDLITAHPGKVDLDRYTQRVGRDRQ